MATTLYLPSSGATGISPAIATGWLTAGSGLQRIKCGPGLTGTSFVSSSFTTNFADAKPTCKTQFVSPQLNGAQTINGTVNFVTYGHGTVSNNAQLSANIRVIASDGTTVRGTPLAITNTVGHYNLTTNRSFTINAGSTLTLTSVSASDGDYLVIEVGGWVSSSNDTITQVWGDSGASDYPYNDSTTTASLNCSLLFSINLNFKSTNTNDLMMMGAGT